MLTANPNQEQRIWWVKFGNDATNLAELRHRGVAGIESRSVDRENQKFHREALPIPGWLSYSGTISSPKDT
jgi:hypothetical protein